MVTQINFGHITTDKSGKSRMSGTTSGLDSKSIVDSMVEAKKIPINKLEEKNQINSQKIQAYQQLNNLLNNLKSSVDSLRDSIIANNNVFQSRIASLNSNSNSVAANYLTVAVSDGAQIGSYTFSNISIAAAKSQKISNFIGDNISVVDNDPTSTLFSPGDFQINNQLITLNLGDSLKTINNKINNLVKKTNVSAKVIKISANNFQLSLKSTIAGSANDYVITDDNQIFDQNIKINWQRQNGTDASLMFDSQTIDRSTNIIDDLFDAISINLLANSNPSDQFTLTIENNIEKVIQTLNQFIDNCNEILIFAAVQQTRDATTNLYIKDAVLGDDFNLRILVSKIQNILSTTTKTSDGISYDMSSIGIETKNLAAQANKPAVVGALELIISKMSHALIKDFEQVRELFSLKYISSNANFAVVDNKKDIQIEQFSLNINISRLTTISSQYFASQTNSIVSATDRYDSQTFKKGSFTINGVTIDLKADLQNEGDSLQDINNKLNQASAITGVNSQIINNNNSYQLMLSTTNAHNIDIIDTDKIFTNNSALEWSDNRVQLNYFDSINNQNKTINCLFKIANDQSSGTIIGMRDSAIDGLIIQYEGSGIDIGEITVKEGVAQKLYNLLESYTNPRTGIIKQNIDDIVNNNDLNDKQITILNERLESQRDKLIKQYAAVEEAIAKANSLLKTLEAQDAVRQANN